MSSRKLPEGWENATLGDVCEMIKRGVAPKYTDGGGICVINQKCIRDHHINMELARRHNLEIKRVNPERYIKRGDVLVNSTGVGTLGRVAQVRVEPDDVTTVDTHVTIIRPKAGLFYPEFFGYMLIKIEGEITSSGEGASGQTELARKTLENKFQVTYPISLPEQKRIVALLDKTFAGINQAVANAEKNLANGRELFESYLNTLFTKKGEGWVEKKLKDFTKSISTGPFGSLLHKSDYVTNGVPLVNPINIVDGKIVPDPAKLISNEIIKRLSSYVLNTGDIVIGRRGEIGRCAVIKKEQEGCVCGTGCFFIRPKENVNSTFLTYLLRSRFYRNKLENVATGATMKNISNKALSNLSVSIPLLEKQVQLIDSLCYLLDKTQHLQSIYTQKLTALQELKQSILQKAFSGELTTETMGTDG